MQKNRRRIIFLLVCVLLISQNMHIYAFDDFSTEEAAEINVTGEPLQATDTSKGQKDMGEGSLNMPEKEKTESLEDPEKTREQPEGFQESSEEIQEQPEGSPESSEEIQEQPEGSPENAEETQDQTESSQESPENVQEDSENLAEVPEDAHVVSGEYIEDMSADFKLAPEEESDFALAEASLEGTTIVVDVTEGEDIGKKAADALVTAGLNATDAMPYTVKIPAGNYKLGEVLHIYSNTTLDCRGVTLTCTIPNVGNMIMSGTQGAWDGESNFNESKKAGGYLGFRNIKVLGGTWIGNQNNSSVIFRMAHATNVTWEGCTLVGCGGAHQAEVCAMDGFHLLHCTFRDFYKPDYRYANYEAIQLDNPCSTITFMEFYLDGLPSRNISIIGCTFSNVPRGIGTHTVLRGAYSEQVTIRDNVFQNIKKEAIVCLNIVDAGIQNNQIINCGGGILFSNGVDRARNNFTTIFDGSQIYGGTIKHDANTVISGNTISIIDSAGMKKSKTPANAITLYGVNRKKTEACRDGGLLEPEDLYYSNILVEDNTITTPGYGILISNIRDSSVRKNRIISQDSSSGSFDGIRLDQASNGIELVSNQIRDFPSSCIYVKKAGFTRITDNSIQNRNGSALVVSSLLQDAVISENTFSVSKAVHAVVLHPGTTSVRVTLKHNQLQGNRKKYGFYLKSGKFTISGNKISHVLRGVQIEKGVKAAIYHLYKIDSKAAARVYINGYPSPIIKNQSALNLSTAVSKKAGQLKVKWKKRTGVSGVQIQYSEKADFSSGNITKKVSGTATGLNLTGLTSGHMYYVRARVYTKRGGVTAYSNYGKTVAVTIR